MTTALQNLTRQLKPTFGKDDVRDMAIKVLLKHIKISDSGCWEWSGALNKGYGQLTFKGKGYAAHRFVMEKIMGGIKDGMWVLHKCDNRKCVNPSHLYQGTPTDNRRDTLERSGWYHPWGRRLHCAKGHKYSVVGYRIAKDGSRACRECQRNYKREQRAKQVEVAQ